MEKNVPKFDKEFIKNYDEDSNRGYFLEVDVTYLKDLHNLHSDLPFLSKRMKIKKCNKLVCNLYDKNEYVFHIRAVNSHWMKDWYFKKVHGVIQFNQEGWLKKPYVDMNTKLRTPAKNDFEKDNFKLMNKWICERVNMWEINEYVRKQRDIKLVKTDKRRNQFLSEHYYHTKKWFSEDLSAIKMKKSKSSKPVYLGLSILEVSKTLMYDFLYDYIKPKYQNNAKIRYVDADSFSIHIKTEDFYKDIADDVNMIHQIMKLIDHY